MVCTIGSSKLWHLQLEVIQGFILCESYILPSAQIVIVFAVILQAKA
jgi:hypothetical protein